MIMRLDVKKEACKVYLLRKYLMFFWAFVKLNFLRYSEDSLRIHGKEAVDQDRS